ncbi:methylated-DNA-[protein]-cysteine S-methyltransferase [Salegentibacter echinorum]|uniref:Methylated-DNA--protein-cysteine methyltransferase n=1 Tax=Salegentibacter echinorum TaxID=1073325 RepID=A0A1M5DR11_SALEC|nr:methylated-DNA--[protein]-cysteine S-methyltransferase [Salegentibacter echinorum]SHF69355.1 methylated-DNA-[protein]-cysteine S-methyltransferase [Salegentibacter echinorum]
MQTDLKTPLGTARISGSEAGISEIKILEEEHPESQNVPDFLEPAVRQLQQYFKGDLEQFNLEINLQGSEFQKKVWRALQAIPYGKTCSYLALAKEIGDVKAIRAVAAANGRNPLWIVIPCHRVIGSDGSLTGYAGGLHRKKWLLEHENRFTQLSLF